MLLVRTYVGASPIHGLGCFAAQPIVQGARVWELTPGFDVVMTEPQWQRLPAWQREHLSTHAYLDSQLRMWVYCADDARFFNRARPPTVVAASAFVDIAIRDIAVGEEITCDYSLFDASPKKEASQ